MSRACRQNGRRQRCFLILTGKTTGKRPLRRPTRRWDDNVRVYLKEMDVNAKHWIDSAQDRIYWRALVNAALNLQVPETMELEPGIGIIRTIF